MTDPGLIGSLPTGALPTAANDRAAAMFADFEEFFEAQRGDLYAALCIVTRNRHEAEELAQDAFVSVWERWDRVSVLADPVGYLYRTAMNAFRSRYRRAALAMKRTLRLTPPDDGIAAIEANDAAFRAIAQLPARQRAAVVLMDVLGYSSEETAHMLGLRSSTVRTHAARAHATLRDTIGRSE